MKRAKKMTRAQKEELSKINKASKNVANSVDYDRKGAIIDEAFRQLEEKKAEPVQREKIKLPLADIDGSKDASGVQHTYAISTLEAPGNTTECIHNALSSTEAINHFNTNLSERSDIHYCTVEQFENDIMIIEGIQIYVRAAINATIRKYNHKKQYGDANTVMSFLKRLTRETSFRYTFEIPGWDRSEKMTIESLKNIQSIFIQEKQLIS